MKESKKHIVIYFIIMILGFSNISLAQTADFNINTEYCLNESLTPINTSTSANSYLWDFCVGDIEELPMIEESIVNVGSGHSGISLLEDQGQFFGFLVGNNSLVRLDFGDSVQTDPVVTSLGNIDGLINSPSRLGIYRSIDGWYGFIGSDDGSNNLVRLFFGMDITSIPSTDNLGNFGGILNRPKRPRVYNDDGNFVVSISNRGTNELIMLNLGSTLDTSIGDITTQSISISNAINLQDFEFVNANGNWFGYGVSANTALIHRLEMGGTLYGTPDSNTDLVATELDGSLNINLVPEGENHYALIGSFRKKAVRYNLGNVSLNPTPQNLDITSSNLFFGLDTEFQHGKIISYAITNTSELDRLVFDLDCGESIASSTSFEPTNLNYSISGNKSIALTAWDINGNESVVTKSALINSDIAPSVDFTIDNSRCIDNVNTFTSSDDGNIASYSWDFNGDSVEDSNQANPTYDYSADGAGTYTITLNVISNDGCSNNTSQEISIYNTPSTPDFDYSVGTLCSNSNITFSNLTDEIGLETIITYLWDFDGEATSTEKDPMYNFTTSGTKTIGLTAMIPSCTTSVYTENLVILDGPSVDFTYSNNCFGEAIQFTDASSGEDVTGYSWDFGDGSPLNTNQNPNHTYTLTDDYTIALTVTNASGCSTPLTKNITVSDDPVVDFSFEEAIENLPTSFYGRDLTSSDDSVTSWSWNFANLGVSTEDSTAFIFPFPENYEVTIDVTTNQGCTGQVIKSVNVNESTTPTINLTLPNTICSGESVLISNFTVNATSYEWDFCVGDIATLPTYHENIKDFGLGYTGITLIEDLGFWYGFVIGENGILRLDFKDSLASTPFITNLGNVEGLINRPTRLEIFKDNNSWFGFFGNDDEDHSLIRLNFGQSLENIPTTENLGNFNLSLNRPRRPKVYIDQGNYIVSLVNRGSDELVLLNFGTTLSNSTVDISSTIFEIDNSSSLQDFEFTKLNNKWYGFGVSANSALLHKLYMGSDLYGSPDSIQNLTAIELNGSLNINLIREGMGYYVLIGGFRNNMVRYHLEDITLSEVPDFLDMVNTSTYLGNSTASQFGKTITYVITTDGILDRLEFDLDCGESFSSSTAHEPLSLSFSSSGSKLISLTAIDENGSISILENEINIGIDIAPSIDFSIDDSRCIDNTNSFTTKDDGNITSYSWDFNNDNVEDDTDPNPEHTFDTTGDHIVKLTVDDGTCTNFAQDTVSVYPVPPLPTFDTSVGVLCTNSDITFTNTTDESDHQGASITYNWNFNSEGTSGTTDTSFVFANAGDKNVSLTMSIPGCSTTYEETITIIPGPNVAFGFENGCFGETAAFTNNTTGDNLANPLWDFGNGYSSTDNNPNHQFEAVGEYDMTLTMENEAGCVNSLEQTILIHGIPEASFTAEIGCEKQLVPFVDTSIPGDALNNINSWSWDFEGLGSSSEENPEFVFDETGTYEVSLTVTNTGGCVTTETQTVSVRPAPIADFDIDLGCLSEETAFSDISTSIEENPVNSWYWEIDEEVFVTQNPSKNFAEPGIYTASLIVTGSNLCAVMEEKDFEVFDLPVVDFSEDKTCDNEFTEFTDLSSSPSSPIISRSWQFANLGSNNGQQTIFNFSEAGDYDVALTVIDELGCSNTMNKVVTIDPAPISDFSVSTDLGAPPLLIDFINSSIGATEYLWQFNDNDNSTLTEESPQFAYAEFGNFNAQLIAISDMGCKDSSSVEIIVTEPMLDLELIEILSEEVNGKINLAITIQNSASLTVNGFDIRIDIENQSSIFESYDTPLSRTESVTIPLNFSLSADNNNIDFVCITLVDQIEEYADENLINNEGCINFDQQVEIENAYPNPVGEDSYVTLQMVLPTKAPVQLIIVNSLGKVLYDETFSNIISGLNTFQVDTRNYRKGMYFLKVLYNGSESTQKVVKM